VYLTLLKEIAPDLCDLSALNEPDLEKRAELFLDQVDKLGCKQFITPQFVVEVLKLHYEAKERS
jgi:hypothetical protein